VPTHAELDALCDLRTPWCVHTVATLGCAAELEDGPRDAVELAHAAGVDARALQAVLIHLADKGVFELLPDGRFALTDTSRALFGQPRFLELDGIGGRMAGAWSTLPQYVRTGHSAYPEVFGMGFWDDLAAHPQVGASFDELMGIVGHGAPDPDFELARGWQPVRHIVEVGGGTGALLAAMLQAHPTVRGTLVDLPGTVARATPTFQQAAVADRVTLAGQSFFDELPAGGDLYLLRKVLNDWPAPETLAILRRCAEAVAPQGSVLVAGGVAPDDEPRALTIEMVLAGGETDTLGDFTALAQQAGLQVLAAGDQRGRYVVELTPAD
jgi:hypothetical protein